MSPLLLFVLVGSVMGHLPSGIGNQVSRPLRLYVESTQAGEVVAAPCSPSGTPSPVELTSADELRLVLRQELEAIGLQPHRIVNPVRLAPVYLRTCLEWIESRRDWAADTRDDYHRLVARWEQYHQGPGPDIRDIGDGDFAVFALAAGCCRAAYRTNFETLLRSQTRLSERVPYGKPAGQTVITEVPYSGKLLRKRSRSTELDDSIRPLGERDVSQLMDHWTPDWPTGSRLMSPTDVGQTVLGLFWFFGLRKCDAWLINESNFDLILGILAYRETKAGNVGAVPLPSVLIPPLWLAAKDAALCGRGSLFPVERKDIECSSDSGVYLRIRRVYEAAGVKPIYKSGEHKWFHGMRASCSTKWLSIASEFRERMTLHSAKSVVDRHYTLVSDEMRDAVERYPVPDALRRLSARIRAEHADCPQPNGMACG